MSFRPDVERWTRRGWTYHFDLPQALDDEGGWTNRDTAGYFAEYCTAVVDRLGDRVKRWMIFNEPAITTWLGYLEGAIPPNIREPLLAAKAIHVTSLAQGLAARAIRAATQSATVGTAYSMFGVYPASASIEDQQAAERMHQFGNICFIETIQTPLSKSGGPPNAS